MMRRLYLFSPILLLFACAHTGPMPDGSDDSWIEPGHSYRGGVTGRDGAFDKTASFRVRTVLGQRLTFRIRTVRTVGNSRSVRLVRPGEQFGPEVESIDADSGNLTETIASVVPPESGVWILSFTDLENEVDHWNYELDFLPAGDPVRPVSVGQKVTGTLSDTDATDAHGYRLDTWRLSTGEGQQCTIAVKGDGFKALLRVHEEKPNGPLAREGWADETPEVTATLRGDSFVEVLAEDRNARGSYTLEVRDALAEAMARMPELAVGGSVVGQLTKDGPRFVRYKLHGTPGKTYALKATSADFSPSAYLFAPGNDHPQKFTVLGPNKAELPADGALVVLGQGKGEPVGGTFVWPEMQELVLAVSTNDDGDVQGSFQVSFTDAQ